MPRLRRAPRPASRLPQLLLLGQAVVGMLLGVVWWALTRRPGAWLVGEPVVTTDLTSYVARDGTFAVLGLVLGVVAGVVVLRHGRERPLLLLTAALCGALAGSLLAAGTGAALPPGDPTDPRHVSVTAWGVLLLWPFGLSGVVLLATLSTAVGDWVRAPRSRADDEDPVPESRA
ncbi:hypothetical protein [Kineococcus rubinsiae]|uniref:hypothetical protein n=1 Tax=Kineococcus rubinsiae TaxID=2609562 RepID=UPI00142FB1B5|nr:hypothetical protein [Kineococcus rubinsiae]NIZ92768.1 hypothetical protein [Kineococcus rubinsiae]